MMTLTPKTIDPGWAKRWTRQSVELFRRAPALAVGVMTLFGLVNAFIPQPFALDVPLTVFMVGILFSELRAADHDSGRAWSATWAFFRQAARYLAHLARDAFLLMLVFGMAMALLFYFYSAATHGAGIFKPTSAYFHLPGWLRHGAPSEGTMLTLGIFMPGVLPLIFLTMSVGNQPLMHYVTGYKSAVLNIGLAYALLGGLLICSFLTPLLKQIPSFFLGCALMAGFAAAFWWFGTWGYLWCREMFEGTTENAPATEKQRMPVQGATLAACSPGYPLVSSYNTRMPSCLTYSDFMPFWIIQAKAYRLDPATRADQAGSPPEDGTATPA